jgi:20S proteasome subunit alpha 4
LLEVVDSGSKNMEVAVIRFGNPVRMLPEEELQTIITDIEREQEEAKRATQEAAPADS